MAASRVYFQKFYFWKRERGSTVFSDFSEKSMIFARWKSEISIFSRNFKLSSTRTEIFEKVDYIGNFSKKKENLHIERGKNS